MEASAPVRPARRSAAERASRRRGESGVLRDGVLRGPPLSTPLAEDSLGLVLLQGMRRHGPRHALVDVVTGDVTTYEDLVRETVSLARALRVLLDDIREERAAKADREDEQLHDVVGVFVENRREMLPSLVANLLLGSPISLLNPLSNTGELVSAWRATRPTVSLCSRATLAVVLEASRSLPTLRHVVVFPGAAPDDAEDGDVASAATAAGVPTLHAVAYEDLLKRVAPGEAANSGDLGNLLQRVDAAQHVAFLLQCGRGGRIARLTHRNLTYTVQLLREPDAAGYGWSRDDVLLLGAPLSHAFGLGLCLGALNLGVKVVLMPHFREQLFLSAVHTHRVTQLVLVPGQAAALARSPLLEDAVVGVARRGVRGLLRGVVIAAAPLPRALHRDLSRRLAAPCRQAYGLTQASCSLLVAPRGAPPDSQGMVVPGAEAKVVAGDKAQPLGPLQVGELLLRAPSIMVGYLDQDEDAMDADGWLRTGDLAYYDAKGCVFVVDRLRDVALYTHFKEFDDAQD